MLPDPQIIYIDDHLVLINKPGNLLAVPGRGPAKQDCAVARMRRQLPDLPSHPAVHRLDMKTSGLMLLARSAKAHCNLARQFEQRIVLKRYLAVLSREPVKQPGAIVLSFRLDPENRPMQIYDPINGKPGVTLWRRIGPDARGFRVEFTPLTGRTHQLRLHAAHSLGLAAPIVGDCLYGAADENEQLLLHASFLAFVHPESGQAMEFFQPPPF